MIVRLAVALALTLAQALTLYRVVGLPLVTSKQRNRNGTTAEPCGTTCGTKRNHAEPPAEPCGTTPSNILGRCVDPRALLARMRTRGFTISTDERVRLQVLLKTVGVCCTERRCV